MKTLKIEVENSLIEDIKELFPKSTSPVETLANLALNEWFRWLKGTERPTKISEQNIQRFISIYGEILPDEVPDMEVLYNEFNIPLGQARYITQAISYKQTGTFHVIALKDILKSVNEKIGNSEPISIIRIKKTSEKVLREIINGLSYNDDSIPTPSLAKDLGKYVDYKLRTHDLQAIKDNVTRKLA